MRRGRRPVGTYISELGLRGCLKLKKFMDFGCLAGASMSLGWLGLGEVYGSEGSEKGL